MAKALILREFLTFMKERKAYWIIPIVMILLLGSLLLLFSESSVVGPFIYTIF